MYLREFTIERFRSCKNTCVRFQRELTVLVGENNGGKSNILDAIRLLTKPLNGRRDRYAEDGDLRRGANPTWLEVTARFEELSDTLKGLLISAVPDPTQNVAVLGYRYEPQPERSTRGRFTTWAGKFKTMEPEGGSTELIRHVYLPALRDANQALGSGSATRVMALLRHFLPEADQPQFLEDLRRGEDLPGVLTRMNADISGALRELTSGVRTQSAEMNFGVETVQDIARDLRFKLGDAGRALEDIRTSGLGYANLLYMSTVIVELTKAREADLTLFLVEEPEAHLHPQLQRLVLEFLLDKSRESFAQAVVAGQPEGRIQVIVSTHSPNLTAWASPKHLVVVRSHTSAAEPLPETKCLSIAELGLADSVLNKISRYLDVTRSALLFGSKAILVEGIAEALLLPVIARRLVLRLDRDALSRFKGSLLIPIDGVDFRPYVEVLLRPHEGTRIADRVVVITDADPELEGNRRADLEALARDLNADAQLRVCTNQVTLEFELFAAGNAALLRDLFLEMRPRSADRWAADVEAKPEGERPRAFVELLASARIRKGDFAQALAARIESGSPFTVPPYLEEAINAISAP